LLKWESGAIIEYIIEKYDKDHKFSFKAGTDEAYYAKQWLFFQVSGQGPYYGQASWFIKFHPEQLPSAIERYTKEMNRVTGVLEGHLAKQQELYGSNGDGPWLVGNKYSFADISFVSWQNIIQMLVPKDQYDLDNFPIVKEWVAKMLAKKAIAKVMDDALKAQKATQGAKA
jgi:glutathione S-transferase